MAAKRSDVRHSLMDLISISKKLESRLSISERPINETTTVEAIVMQAIQLMRNTESCTFTNGVDMHEVDTGCDLLYNGCNHVNGKCIMCGGEE